MTFPDWPHWFDQNLIYNQDTKSFSLRLAERTKNSQTRDEIQQQAFKIVADMKKEYLQQQNDQIETLKNSESSMDFRNEK